MRIVEILLGFNIASLPHLARLNPQRFLRACRRAFNASKSAPRISVAIPGINLGDILGDRKPIIRLSVTAYEDGMLPSEQAMALLSILVAEAPKEVLEIGTYIGHTTRQMAENLTTATIHTVDLPEDFSAEDDPSQAIPKDDFHLISRRVVGREFRNRSYSGRIIQHFADTAKWDFQQVGRPTFIFIDGSHTYEYCRSDSEKCFAVAGANCVFLWHDCDEVHPGVVRYLCECRDRGMDIKLISGTALAYWKRP